MKPGTVINVFILSFILSGTYASDKGDIFNNVYIDSKLHYGFIIPHHKSIAYLLERHVYGFEINVSRPTYGRHIWEQLYRNPRRNSLKPFVPARIPSLSPLSKRADLSR